jgi:fringe protein
MYVIRTSSKFYRNRLIYFLQTWILFVHKHVYFVADEYLPNISYTHLIRTNNTCGQEIHTRNNNLCCKTAHDFILFHRYRTKYDWFCHFDDDQYVNIKILEKYLSTLDSNHPYYIGRNSWSSRFKRTKEPYPHSFWFATLGAGVCLSKYLIDLLQPYTRNISQFINGCLQENYNDDVYLGFLISAYLNVTLTKNFRFHSHLEKDFYDDKQIFFQTFTKQITFSFRFPHHYPAFLPNLFKSQYDPYRIRTLHCLLYPYIFECQTKIRQHLFNITK